MLNENALKKASGVEWIEEIPKHWETWKASHGFKLIGSGTTPKTDNLEYYDGDVHWVTTSELRETVILDTSTKLTEAALRDYSSLHKYPVGTLLIAMYGATIGRLGILGIEATLNQACCAFSDSETFDTKFFYYWLMYRRPILLSLSSGGGQPNLNQEELRALRVPIPPLEEQQAIAEMLDRETRRLDELITEKERMVELLAEKRRALITNAVTRGLDPNAALVDSGVEWLGDVPQQWQVKRTKYIAEIYGGSTPTTSNPEFWDGDVVWVTPADVSKVKGIFIFDSQRKITQLGLQSCATKLLDENSIVLTTRAPIGNLILAGSKFTTNQGCKSLVVKQENPTYFYYQLGELKEVLDAHGTGTTFKELSTDSLNDFLLAVPPLNEQQEIVKYIEAETGKIARLQAATVETIELLKERRASLIAAAVTGKISVA